MRDINVLELYIKRLQKSDHLKNKLNDQILYGYKNIIDYLKEFVFLKDYYTYENLMEASKLELSKRELLLEIVYILTVKEIDVLKYKFEVYDEDNDRMIDVNAERVFRAYLKNEFFHPLNGKTISIQEFNHEIIPFFSTTNSFKMKVKQDSNV